jgi:hypothetical protein
VTENPIIIDDDDDSDTTDRSNHTSYQMTVHDPGIGGENAERDAGGTAYIKEGVAKSDSDDTAMSQDDDRSTIATSTSLAPGIPESDSGPR